LKNFLIVPTIEVPDSRRRDLSEPNAAGYFHARLTEASGDRVGALSLYRSFKTEFSPFEELIQAGIARCQK